MEYIENVRSQLLEEVEPVPEADWNIKTDTTDWSIAQVVEHLRLFEAFVGRSMKSALETEPTTRAEEKPIQMMKYRRRPAEAPQELQPEDMEFGKQNLLEELKETREYIRHLEEKHTREDLAARSISHPNFGPMPLHQWLEMIGLHEERHIAQIQDIKTKL
ncbi:DinB family protein [Marinococcus sp. PL1-022]|jgi:uncharacterized damage-inducible protein DinB|uniref:DinB family protein n=1 Tax=Marinococcus sp. PL1-022 TaxID=3095363 RepID=UPI002616C69E|nr:DinB family protein [Marinococcus sp. PL1-022]MDX6151447.1 DinB family protein [Marinococcus sp. PL1-022]